MSPYPGPVLGLLPAAALAGGSLVFHAVAQDPCAIPNYTQAWVDPVGGSDGTGALGDRSRPYRTIAKAAKEVSGAVAGTADAGLVHCLPGTYSPSTNGEPLPLAMADGVHVRGKGAQECVIRGAGAPNAPVFLPVAPLGATAMQEVLVDFGAVTPALADPASIDGFTFLGGDVQVLFLAYQGEARGRVSNCLFDLRHVPEKGLQGPAFGILMVSPYLGANSFGYRPCRPHVLHCTFVQGYRPAAGPVEVARPASAAICDVTDNTGDPLLISGQANYPALRGIGAPSVQNCIFRSLPEAPRTALLGLDDTDTTAILIPGLPIPLPSNAFALALNGQTTFDTTWTYASAYLGTPPSPCVDLTATDPAFVGEMVGDLNLQAGLSATAVRDFRLLFDSPLVNRGRTTPLHFPGCAASLLFAPNGTSYQEPLLAGYLHGSLRFDGEGYGNPRVAYSWMNPGLFPMPDLGFDESESLVVSGSYANESRSHGKPWDATIPYGDFTRWYFLPDPPDPFPGFYLFGAITGCPTAEAWSEYPGTGQAQTWTTIQNAFWLSKAAALDLGYWPLSPLTWIDPVDGTAHRVRHCVIPYDDTNFPNSYFVEQAAVYRFGTIYLTNAVPEHL